MKLSVLDQTPVRSGATPVDAVRESIELAQLADRLGYTRYWVAEHHGTDGFAGCAPEIMVTRLAAATSRIRIGSGGVMLSHYSPYKVAETFKLLDTLFPGRIDLGIGRAPGSDQITARALAYGSPIGGDYFPTKVADMLAFLSDDTPATEALAHVRATPRSENVPEIWLLGSSGGSASLACHFGLPFSFAHFISPDGGDEIIRAYKEDFQPSALYSNPRVNLGVFVVCAENEEDADLIARSRDLWRLRLDKGELTPYPSVQEALDYSYTAEEWIRVERNRKRTIVGNPDQVKTQLSALASAYGADELVVLTICHDFAARLRSYELLAEAFDLESGGRINSEIETAASL